MPTYFFNFVNSVITEDASKSVKSSDNGCDDVLENDNVNPIAYYDEELSKTFRKIQELLNLTLGDQKVNDEDDDTLLLLENLLLKAEYLLHMMGQYYKKVGVQEEKQQWKEIINLRFETMDHLQKRQKYITEVARVSS